MTRQLKPTRGEKEKATQTLRQATAWTHTVHERGAIWRSNKGHRYVVSMAEHRAMIAAAMFLEMTVNGGKAA